MLDDRILKSRNDAGLTQAELGVKVNRSRATVILMGVRGKETFCSGSRNSWR